MATPSTSSTAPPSGPVGPTPPSMEQLLARQAEYQDLQYKVALGMVVLGPILVALPPRKLDHYTFGLGLVWLYTLNEVSKHHGGKTIMERVFNLNSQKENEKPLDQDIKKGWLGESVFAQYREREEEGKGIAEMIMESVWDVWQQRDKRSLTREQEEEEELPLRERIKKVQEEREKVRERTLVDELVKKT
ncbi:hypothetical protein BZA77DRAFT_323692 [Pyronema omphalodes]|nr:hypothetical protein BZA77DRAFT_323692 [Pyronema omphalodes]